MKMPTLSCLAEKASGLPELIQQAMGGDFCAAHLRWKEYVDATLLASRSVNAQRVANRS